MNRYVEDAMKSTEGLPSTFEEYQRMHPVHAKMVPMAHVQKLRDEFDGKTKSQESGFKPIKF